jgi:hypothetical protein
MRGRRGLLVVFSQAADEVPQTPLHFIRNMTSDPAMKNDIKVLHATLC